MQHVAKYWNPVPLVSRDMLRTRLRNDGSVIPCCVATCLSPGFPWLHSHCWPLPVFLYLHLSVEQGQLQLNGPYISPCMGPFAQCLLVGTASNPGLDLQPGCFGVTYPHLHDFAAPLKLILAAELQLQFIITVWQVSVPCWTSLWSLITFPLCKKLTGRWGTSWKWKSYSLGA